MTLTANRQRVGVTVSTLLYTENPLERVTIAAGGAVVISLIASNNRIHMPITEYGDLPMRELTITAGAGGALIGVIEYFMPEEYLAAAQDRFNSEYGK